MTQMINTAFALPAIAVTVLYLCSPMFYSYFDIAALYSFGEFPALREAAEIPVRRWPLSSWGAILENYQPAKYFDPAKKDNLACRLTFQESAKRVSSTDCEMRMESDTGAFGPYISIRGGEYIARYEFASQPDCNDAKIEFRVSAQAGQHILSTLSRTIAGGDTVSLAFPVEGFDRIGQGFETALKVESGCAVLSRVSIEPASGASTTQ